MAPDVNSTRKAHISHFEKFPSRGRHATFVTSVQPETAELGNDLPVTVTVTIFAPDYVPNETRHSVSFFFEIYLVINDFEILKFVTFLQP